MVKVLRKIGWSLGEAPACPEPSDPRPPAGVANDIATNGRTAAAAADVNAEPDPADVLREVDTAGDVPKVA